MSYDQPEYDRNERRPGSGGGIGGGLLRMLFRNPRILGALAVVVIGLFTYYSQTEVVENPVTGRKARVMSALTPDQEVILGLQSVPEMARQFGGELGDPVQVKRINLLGGRLLAAKDDMLKRRNIDDFDYPFQFHILRDNQTINAFALPGGQIFITQALLRRLPTDDAVAGVIGHEIGHVLARHSNQQMAKNSLLQSYAQAAAVVASGDGRGGGQAVGQFVGQVLQTKYGREDETESDRIGVQLLILAGYEPGALLVVMDVLEEASSGSPRGPEWLSSHPSPPNRKTDIKEFIKFFREDKYGVWK